MLIMVWGFTVATFTLYLWTLPATITTYDSGELIVGPATLSIVHPPGYPLYMVLGHVLALCCPIGPVAFRVNVFSAVCTVCAMVWLACLLRTGDDTPGQPKDLSERGWWNTRSALALGAAALGALLPQIWNQAITAEVYALNLVMLACLAWILTRWSMNRLPRWSALGGLILGIGLTNHHILLLLVPCLAVLCWGSSWRGWAAAGLLLGLGLTLYLALMLRSFANPPMDWGNPERWSSLLAHALRKQYRPFGGEPRTMALMWDQLSVLGTFFAHQWKWIGLVAAAGWAGWWAKGRTHAHLWLLASALLVLSVGLVLLTNFRPIPFQINQVQSFFTPALWLSALACGSALLWLHGWLPWPRVSRVALVSIVWLLTGGLAWTRAHQFNRSGERITYSYGRDLLDSIPDGSAVIVTGDFPTFPLAYLRYAEGARPSVDVFDDQGLVFPYRRVDPSAILNDSPHAIYRTLSAEILEPKEGLTFIPDGLAYRAANAPEPPRSSAALWRRLRFGRPYGQEPRLGTLTRYLLTQYYAFAVAEWRLARGDRERAIADYQRIVMDPTAGDTLTNTIATLLDQRGLLEEAAHTYRIAATKAPWSARPILGQARILSKLGQADRALALYHKAIEVEPRSGTPYFQLANFLADQHQPHEAIQQYRKALIHDPSSASIRKNMAAAYLDLNQLQQALEMTAEALRFAPTDYQLYHNFGASAQRLGDLDRALVAFERAAQLAPDNRTVLHALRALKKRRGGARVRSRRPPGGEAPPGLPGDGAPAPPRSRREERGGGIHP